MAAKPRQAEYSIAAVSKLTGVSCHALRVWERRYGYPRPERSPSNQRRYGADQVHALRRIAELARSGRPIGELIADLRAGRLEAEAPAEDEAADVLEPALVEVGERWFRGAISVYQEHLASGVILRSLGRALDDARHANLRPARRAVIATVQGERHEGGVLILGLMLELAGWRTLTLGVDLPVAELRRAVEAWRPDAVGVSFVLSRSINKRFRELAAIRGVPVFVGGRSLMNHRALARSHGLIPLTGPIASAIPQWMAEFARLAGAAGS
jgi:methanogenic corrinoid protein MtbC1